MCTSASPNSFRQRLPCTYHVHGQLYANDEAQTHVAKFHQQDFISITPKAKAATLEIFPAGEHMVDLIVVTLVYIEKLRRRAGQCSFRQSGRLDFLTRIRLFNRSSISVSSIKRAPSCELPPTFHDLPVPFVSPCRQGCITVETCDCPILCTFLDVSCFNLRKPKYSP